MAADPPESAPVLTGRDYHTGHFGDDRYLFARVPLVPGRVTGAALFFETGGIAQIGAQQPWEIGARIDICDYAFPGCATWAIMTLKGEGSPVSLGVIDQAGALIERTSVPDTAGMLALEVQGHGPEAAPAVIVQAGPDGGGHLRLADLRLGFSVSAAAASLSLAADASVEEVARALEHRFSRQLEGAAPAGFDETKARDLLTGSKPPFRNPAAAADGPEGAAGATGQAPWDYIAQVGVPPTATGGDLRVRVGPVSEPVTLFLVDTGFTGRVSPAVEIRVGKAEAEVWLAAPPAGAWLVLQAGAEPKDQPVSLRRVEFAPRD